MIELVTIGDRKFEVTRTIKIPTNLSEEKLGEALVGIVHLRRLVNGERYLYFVNEVVDATFVDILPEPNFEEKKQEILDAAAQVLEEKKDTA